MQLILFVAMTLVGVSYVSAKYVGLFNGIFGPSGCTVSANFADSGGIFTNAEVTYRGVTVGQVGNINLTPNGVKVDLKIKNCSNPTIPVDSSAAVSDRSVIGEQYVNVIPSNANGPFMAGGEVIPQSRTTIPIAPEALLTNLDNLANSVNTTALQTTVLELGKALNNKGADLGSLLDSTNELLTAAQANLPVTIDLLRSSSTVLSTQLNEAGNLQSFANSLNLLSAQLKSSDPDIRNLLDNGPTDLAVVRQFVQDNQTDLGVTFANLADVGQLLVRHLDGIEQIFELYPALVAGGYGVLNSPKPGKAGFGQLGLVVNVNNPPDCGDPLKPASQGYEATVKRDPSIVTPAAPNVAAQCTAPVSTGTDIRGSANVPGGDPISISGGGVAYPRVATENTVTVGNMGTTARILGDRSWIGVLTTALH